MWRVSPAGRATGRKKALPYAKTCRFLAAGRRPGGWLTDHRCTNTNLVRRTPPASNCHHRALSPHVGAWHRAGPAERYCSPSRSCARCVTSSASGRTYAAHSVDCSTDAAAVQPTASRWCDNLEREPEREPECGPSHVPWPQPDSWSRTRSCRCRRWRLPKRRSPRRIRKSSGRRGGRAGAEAEEGDEPGCEGVEALGVRWPRAHPRVAVCFR